MRWQWEGVGRGGVVVHFASARKKRDGLVSGWAEQRVCPCPELRDSRVGDGGVTLCSTLWGGGLKGTVT